MKALLFDIYLEQPVLIARTEPGDENSAAAMLYVPGSSLRGALIQRYMMLNNMTSLPLGTDYDLFFEDFAFLNAYPQHSNGKRAMPTPLSWRVDKEYRRAPNAEIYDLASSNGAPSKIIPATLVEPFFVIEDDHPQLVEPERVIEIHNSGWERRVKKAQDSQVFRYESLAPNQTFCAVIVGKEIEKLQADLQLTDEVPLWFGRSRSANYGQVHLRNFRIEQDWHEGGKIPSKSDFSGQVVILLTSDAILFNQYGQPDVSLDTALGLPAGTSHSWHRSRIVGGFNRTWGLPLPQSLAVQAGSVYVMDASSIDFDRLKQAIQDGIGLRREEGFGRLALWLNPPSSYQRAAWQMRAPGFTSEQPKLNENEDLGRRIGLRYLSGLLDQRLAQSVADLKIEGIHDRAQLSRLRGAARQASERQNLHVLTNHIQNLMSAAEKIRTARVKRVSAPKIKIMRLNEWIEELVNNASSDDFWQPENGQIADFSWNDLLALSLADKEEIIGLEPMSEELRKLKADYIIRLIDSTLRKASREMQQDENEQKEEQR